MQRKKLNFDLAVRAAEKRGGKCLSTAEDLTGTHAKFEWECKNGHRWFAQYRSVVQCGTWCARCECKNRDKSKKNSVIIDCVREAQKRSKKTPVDIKRVRAVAKERGGQCLTNHDIVDRYSQVRLKCKHGHTWSTQARCIVRGNWCPRCAIDRRKPLTRKRGIKTKTKQASPKRVLNFREHSPDTALVDVGKRYEQLGQLLQKSVDARTVFKIMREMK